MQNVQIHELQKIVLPNKSSILERFDALAVVQSIVVKNTHNMEILRYQLQHDRGNTFAWKYLEQGPNNWRVRITKLGNKSNAQGIGELAVDDYRKAELFHRFGIDYCCNGNKSLRQAFEEAGVSDKIWNEWYLETLQHKNKEIHEFANWKISLLVDYLINTHHAYIRNNSELISRLAYKVTARHGFAYPELNELKRKLSYFLRDLNNHIDNEEQQIFPAIKKIIERHRNNRQLRSAEMEELDEFKQGMIKEHKLFGDEIKHFRNITKNYKLPADACSTYTHFYAKLLEFENDLIQHIHLENNILLPKLKQ